MFAFLLTIVILSVLIVIHELGHFFMAKLAGVRVEQFSLGFGPKVTLFKHKKTEYSLGLIPLGGFVKLAGDTRDEYKGLPHEYLAQGTGKRAAIVFCGPLFNYILSLVCFSLLFFIGYPALSAKVGEVMDGYPAQAAGFVTGDKIIRVDGAVIDNWEQLQETIHKRTDAQPLRVTLVRNDQELNLDLVPRIEKIKNLLGRDQSVALIGIKPADEIVTVKYGLLKSLQLGFGKTFYITKITCQGLFLLATGGLSFRDSVTGPLGIFYITHKVALLGFGLVLNLIAVLGVSLAIFNLLPLPILDGGHIVFLGLEKLRGRPLDRKVDEVITRIGFSFIITLAIIVTANDVLKFGWIEKIMGLFVKVK